MRTKRDKNYLVFGLVTTGLLFLFYSELAGWWLALLLQFHYGDGGQAYDYQLSAWAELEEVDSDAHQRACDYQDQVDKSFARSGVTGHLGY